MEYIEYQDPKAFLRVTQFVLEENEALYGLMFGISLRLVENPFHYGTQPYLATIASRRKLELIALMTPRYKFQIASLNNKSIQAIDLLAFELHKGDWHVPIVIAVEEIAKHFESE